MPQPTHATAEELRFVLGRLIRRLREEVRPSGLTPSQKTVLIHLERNGQATVSALAKAEGVRPQSMGATVASLEALGFVEGAPNPNDGRQTVLTVTADGHAWIKAARAESADWLFRAISANLNAAEQAELASAVRLLARLVE